MKLLSPKNMTHLLVVVIIVILIAIIVYGIFLYTKPKTSVSNINDSSVILTQLQEEGLSCVYPDQTEIAKNACTIEKVAGIYAKGTMPMAYWIAMNTDNKWHVIISGNGIPSCEEIDKYTVPKEIFGNCIEKSGNLRF